MTRTPNIVASYKSLAAGLSLCSLSSLVVALCLVVACSQSTAHPPALGDCTSPTGCNPVLGTGATPPGSNDGGGREGGTGGDGGAEASTDSGGAADAPAND